MRTLLSSILLVVVLTLVLSWSPNAKPAREYYQLTVYRFSNDSQEKMLDNYLQNALLPTLHRMNISSVGVFKAIANDTSAAKSLYVFYKIKSPDAVTKLAEKINADKGYQATGAEYIDAVYTAPPYDRMETILLHAFPLAPVMQLPVLKSIKKDRVYELRSYESHTEKIFKNKVHMFNEGDEIGLFKRLNFNAVFYSEVIAGSKMPNLMYMTCFENKADRDEHWKNFGADAQWKKLSALPEYQKNVSKIEVTFLRPVEYSDF